jgi:hypothetical protein
MVADNTSSIHASPRRPINHLKEYVAVKMTSPNNANQRDHLDLMMKIFQKKYPDVYYRHIERVNDEIGREIRENREVRDDPRPRIHDINEVASIINLTLMHQLIRFFEQTIEQGIDHPELLPGLIKEFNERMESFIDSIQSADQLNQSCASQARHDVT